MIRSPYLKYIENWQNIQFHIFLDSLDQNCDIPPPELIECKVKGVQLMEKINKQIRWHWTEYIQTATNTMKHYATIKIFHFLDLKLNINS